MKKLSQTEDTDPRILDRLRAYTALDNPIRLRAFRLIHDSPGLPFHEIAKAVRIEFANPSGRSSSRHASVLQRVAARQR